MSLSSHGDGDSTSTKHYVRPRIIFGVNFIDSKIITIELNFSASIKLIDKLSKYLHT